MNMLWIRWKQSIENLKEDHGMGVVEVLLIRVVLIGLVLIFKSQLTSIVNSIFQKIVNESSGI